MDVGARFPGTVVVIAPHQDDETLACGGLLALLAGTRDVHVVFATDGSRSPIEANGGANTELVSVREEEARSACALLGVPRAHAHFLRFPDGALDAHEAAHEESLVGILRELRPATVLIPFRYDWHPDHRAVHRVTVHAFAQGTLSGQLVEYFVYTQRRLIPGGDMRAVLDPRRLWTVDTRSVAAAKRAALECFHSQTTRFFAWQSREILTPKLLDRVCESPEVFLPYTPRLATRFGVPASYLAIADFLEPRLKRMKDRLLGWRGK